MRIGGGEGGMGLQLLVFNIFYVLGYYLECFVSIHSNLSSGIPLSEISSKRDTFLCHLDLIFELRWQRGILL
jgi:hypothetical protein